MWYFRSPQIVYGEDSLSFLNTVDIKKAVIVTDRNLAGTDLPEKVRSSLPEGAESIVVSDISEEPTISEMTNRLDMIREFSPDWFIGLGGGSSMDTSKILFFLYERPDLSVYDATPLVPLNLRQKSRLIAIPTTSGTGSECSWAAVLSEENEKRKSELASPEILPDYAILDPEMVLSLPPEQTRNTAVDAITHSIEAYVSSWDNPYSDALSEKAMELILGNLDTVLSDLSDIEARNSLHIGASMAGLSFSNSQIGLAHAMGHALGAHYRVAHGKAVGIYLPHVVSFNYPVSGKKYDRLNRLFPDKYRKNKLNESLNEFFKHIGQPLHLADLNINGEDYGEKIEDLVSLASESTGILTNPRDSSSEELRELFLAVTGE